MNKYHLKLTLKTRFLNFLRLAFTLSLVEQCLLKLVFNFRSQFFKKLIPPNYLYKTNSIRCVTRNGINYRLDIRNVVDHGIFYQLEDNSYSSILDEIKNAKVILDIGGNIGSTALQFAKLSPAAQILVFEPHPETFKRAAENKRLNIFSNIQLINCGLGERKESLKLYEVNETNPGMNRIIAEEKDFPFKEIQVEMLDSIVSERGVDNVDFIKIDVEGFEYSVLVGGALTIARFKPILFIELDDNNLRENNQSAKELIRLLNSFGYSQIYRADNCCPITTDDEFSDCHFDIIALHK